MFEQMSNERRVSPSQPRPKHAAMRAVLARPRAPIWRLLCLATLLLCLAMAVGGCVPEGTRTGNWTGNDTGGIDYSPGDVTWTIESDQDQFRQYNQTWDGQDGLRKFRHQANDAVRDFNNRMQDRMQMQFRGDMRRIDQNSHTPSYRPGRW